MLCVFKADVLTASLDALNYKGLFSIVFPLCILSERYVQLENWPFRLYSGRFPQVGTKLLSSKNIFMPRFLLMSFQRQTHHTKQLNPSQKRLQTA